MVIKIYMRPAATGGDVGAAEGEPRLACCMNRASWQTAQGQHRMYLYIEVEVGTNECQLRGEGRKNRSRQYVLAESSINVVRLTNQSSSCASYGTQTQTKPWRAQFRQSIGRHHAGAQAALGTHGLILGAIKQARIPLIHVGPKRIYLLANLMILLNSGTWPAACYSQTIAARRGL
jgi:hypothetical protein